MKEEDREHLLYILKYLKTDVIRAIVGDYIIFLCNATRDSHREIFQEYLYKNILDEPSIDEYSIIGGTWGDALEDDPYVFEGDPAIWEKEDKESRLNWLNKHIKLLEDE